ncbi:MAG: hypothetical protein KC561_16295 [Myxococcales bacterium]|nr:hypothetical protein [Myxococcales bacterium]
MSYESKQFSDIADSPLGKRLWDFLNEHDNIIRAETATYLGRPAVEPLGPILVQQFPEFGKGTIEDRIKQTIGHMTRQILEERGYTVDRQGVRIKRDDNPFVSATRYRQHAIRKH